MRQQTITTSMPANRGAQSHLPSRYNEQWKQTFVQRALDDLGRGACILDVGSGREPTIAPFDRPEDCAYVGLDISERELLKSPSGSYNEYVVSDVTTPQPQLEERFDLVLSWQVLEHVKPLDQALTNARSYLKPGGRLLVQFSGTFSVFGLLNQVVPPTIGRWLLRSLVRRDPETVFPAYYHHCWESKLRPLMQGWQSFEIVPLYRGAYYWQFSRLLQRMYLSYENWAQANRHGNLATHYIVDARR